MANYFKVGQIVRCVDSDHEHLYKGSLYRIKKINVSSDMCDIEPLLESDIPEIVKNGSRHFKGFFTHRFEALSGS
jgi:hypothetical protein